MLKTIYSVREVGINSILEKGLFSDIEEATKLVTYLLGKRTPIMYNNRYRIEPIRVMETFEEYLEEEGNDEGHNTN